MFERPHITNDDRPSITASPWYWVYLFAAAGLVALVLMGPKFAARQAQIERKYQARQRAVQQLQGKSPQTPLSSAHATSISLRPLYIVLTALLGLSGANLLRIYFRRRRNVRHREVVR